MSEKPTRSTRSLWLIALVCAAPVIASYLAYYFWQPTGHTNYGELVTAPPLPNTPVRLVDGSGFEIASLRGKWVLLMTDSGQCAEPCERKLFTMRQLRLTQGKEMERIERAWLISDAGMPAAKLVEDYRGTWFVRAGDSDLIRSLPADRPATEYIYLLDPLGNVVLRYGRDAEPAKIIKDLARVLKTSRIG